MGQNAYFKNGYQKKQKEYHTSNKFFVISTSSLVESREVRNLGDRHFKASAHHEQISPFRFPESYSKLRGGASWAKRPLKESASAHLWVLCTAFRRRSFRKEALSMVL